MGALIAHGAAVDAADREGLTALMFVCYAPVKPERDLDHLRMVKMLIEHGADVNAVIRTGASPLKFACWRSNSPVATLLKEQGATTQCDPIKEKSKCSSLCSAALPTPGHTTKPKVSPK